MALLHNWKFNGNTFDSVNIPAQVTATSFAGRTGIDLVIQPEQLGITFPPKQHARDVTTVTFPPGPRGKYLKWNGVNQCAAFAEIGYWNTNPTGNFSPYYEGIFRLNNRSLPYNTVNNTLITCWVKYDGTVRPGFKFQGPIATVIDLDISLDITAGTTKFSLNDVEFGGVISADTWYFISILYRANTPTKLYASVNNGAETSVIFSTSTTDEDYSSLYCYDGLDDLRIYQNITDDKVSEVYDLGLSEEVADNISFGKWRSTKRQFKFDDPLTRTPVDNINPIPFYNPVTGNSTPFNFVMGSSASYADGKIGKAIKTGQDGRTALVPIDDNYSAEGSYPATRYANDTVGNFSIAFWIGLGYNLTAPIGFSERYVQTAFGAIMFSKDFGYYIAGQSINLGIPTGKSHGFLPLAVYPNFDHVVFVYQKKYGRTVVYVNGIPRVQIKNSLDQGSAKNRDYGSTISLSKSVYGHNSVTYGGLTYLDDLRTYGDDLVSSDVLAIYSNGYGTQDSAYKGSIYFSTSSYINYLRSTSFIALSTLAGVVRKTNLVNSVLQTTFSANHFTSGRVNQVRTLNHNAFSSFISTGTKRHTFSALKVAEFSRFSTLSMSLIKTYHSTMSVLEKPNYLYHQLPFSGFYSYTRARYIKPDSSPPINNRPPYIYPIDEAIRGGGVITAQAASPVSTSSRVKNFVPSFPRNATEGMQIIDKYGNKWTYISKYDSWISKGDVTPPDVVTDARDGIITPDIYNKLKYLNTWSGKIPPQFKLAPNTEAYYYYFRSSDDLIDFSPEQNNLRVEVNRGKLFNILHRQICPGDQGPIGNQGPQGGPGFPAKDELAFVPVFETFNATFKVFTITPLVAGGNVKLPNGHVPDISIRLYNMTGYAYKPNPNFYQVNFLNRYFFDEPKMLKEISVFSAYLDKYAMGLNPTSDDTIPASVVFSDTFAQIASDPVAEVLIDPLGKVAPRLNVFDSTLKIDKAATLSSFVYNNDDNFTSGSFVFVNSIEPNSYAVRVMQKGPDGLMGDTGTSCLEIKQCLLDGQHIVGTCPVVNIRIDCEENTFYTHCADLIDNLCVQYVSLQSNNIILTDRDVLDSKFFSVEVTLKENKIVMNYAPTVKPTPQRELDFTNWTPTGECRKARHFESYSFLWDDGKDTVCTPAIFADGPLKALGQLANAPVRDGCCEEPFFYFPAIENAICPVTTTPPPTASSTTPAPTPRPTPPAPPAPTPPAPTPPVSPTPVTSSSYNLPPVTGIHPFKNEIKISIALTKLTPTGGRFYNRVINTFLDIERVYHYCINPYIEESFNYFFDDTTYKKVDEGFDDEGIQFAVYGDTNSTVSTPCPDEVKALKRRTIRISLVDPVNYLFSFDGTDGPPGASERNLIKWYYFQLFKSPYSPSTNAMSVVDQKTYSNGDKNTLRNGTTGEITMDTTVIFSYYKDGDKTGGSQYFSDISGTEELPTTMTIKW